MTRASQWLGAGSILVLAVLATTPADAAGTASGSTIMNSVTMNYQVGGVAQTAQTASDTFTVDRKVNVVVTESAGVTTTVSPGQSSAVTTFVVTNSSNTAMDFALTAANQTGGAGAHSNTDNFDVTNLRTYVDTNGNGVYDAADQQVTYLDELAPDSSKTVFIVADIPAGRSTGDVAAVTLTASAHDGGTAGSLGATSTASTGANTAGVDTVFADGAGATDAARDGAYSAKSDYTISTAALTLSKVSSIISDPFNNTTNPKFIPGSVVQYCITVKNTTGSASATNVVLSDVLPATTTYVSSYGILVNGTVTGTTCNLDGTAGGSYSSGTVSGTIPTVVAGDARTIVFRVTVN